MLLPPSVHNTYIIVPAYNEQPGVLLETCRTLLQLPYRLILVDDGSAEPVPHLFPGRIFLLRHAFNLGQGAALQTGFAFARRLDADYVVTFDADGQHSIDAIPQLLFPLASGEADIALGSRFLDGRTRPARFRQWTLHTGRLVNYLFTGLWLSDAHNGLRALNKKALFSIELTENRMAHATEILHRIRQHRLRHTEVPVQISYSAYSREKGQSSWNGIRIFFDLVLHKLLR